MGMRNAEPWASERRSKMKNESKKNESVHPLALSKRQLAGFAVAALVLVLTSLAETPGDVFKIADGEEPTVATDVVGNAVVLWETVDGQGGVEVRGRGFDTFGKPLGFEFGITDAATLVGTTTEERHPAAVFLPDDEFFVAWESSDGDESILKGRRFASTGKPLGFEIGMPLGSEFEISSAGTRELVPSVGADDMGNIVVAWAGPPSHLPHLPVLRNHVRRFDSLGKPLGFEAQFGLSGEDSPAVAVRPAGEFLVVWETRSRSINGLAFNSFGKPLGFVFRISERGPGKEYSPSVATALDGDFTVVWEREARGRTQERRVYGRRVSAAGKPLGFEFLVSSTPSAAASRPSIAADQQGNTLVTWRCLDSGGHDDGILARRIDLQGKPLGFEFEVTATNQVGYSKVSRGGQTADFLVVWEAPENGSSLAAADSSIFGRCLMLPVP